jgi:hypothetical protein
MVNMSIEMQFIPKEIKLQNNVDDVTIKYSNNNAPLTRTPITVQNEIVKKVESYKAPADDKRLMSYIKNYNNPPLTRTPKPVFGKSTPFDRLFK